MADTTCSRCSRPLARLAADGLCETCRRGETGAHNPRPPGDTQFLLTPAADPDPFAPTQKLDWAEAPPPLLPGYDIRDTLGGGGMGVVYLARDEDADRLVALKVVRAATDRAARERFRVEVRAMARLSHPNVVRVYAVELDRPDPFFTMEYVDGPGLDRRLVADGPLPVAEAARVMEQVARAVQHAHDEGVIHRDLKPGNVIVGSDGVPKVTDFGLAKRLDTADGLTVWDAVLGTPGFMAPEQTGGRNEEVGPAADVYGLGATLYALLAGLPPFRGTDLVEVAVRVRTGPPTPLRELRSEVPPDLEAVVLKCLEKAPQDRYPSAADFADDLARWRKGEPTIVRPLGFWRKGWRAVRRRPSAALVPVLAAAVAAAVIGAWWPRDQEQPPAPTPYGPTPKLIALLPGVPVPLPGFVPELSPEGVQQSLQDGEEAVLVGPTALRIRPAWGLGACVFGPSSDGATRFSLQTRGATILHLLSNPGIDHYLLRTELRQDQKIRDSSNTAFGLAVGHARVSAGGDSVLHGWTAVGFDERNSAGFTSLVMGFTDYAAIERPPEPLRSFSDLGRNVPIAAPEPGERPWRVLEVEVSRAGITVRHDGRTVSYAVGDIQRHWSDRVREIHTDGPAVTAALPPWSPRLPLGIWAYQSWVSVRNVTIKPLP
ncbi:MAG TPA: serine/threonine-protein kinase [Fimbriiglobus sp.]|nr:serine/threonine-protein kinase [Fimbriiglobus sp.]